jgi:hypothetical protein
MSGMERAEVLKLYLVGGLCAVAFVLSGLVYTSTIPVDDPKSQATQYLLVGVLLGVIFVFFGGFGDVTVRSKRWAVILRRSNTALREVRHRARARLFDHIDLDTDSPSVHIERAVRSTVAVVSTGHSATVRSEDIESTGSDLAASTTAHGLTVRPTSAVQINQAVNRYESMVLDRLMAEGLLTRGGPITDEDVGVLLATSIISAELSERLHRLVEPAIFD